MSKYKILGADQKEYGPVGVDEIRMWIQEGRANGQSLVQPEGVTGWHPLAAIPELAAVLAAIANAPAPFSATPIQTIPPQKNTMAIAGFICSLIGALCCLSTIFSIAGLVLCLIAMRQIKKNPGQDGYGLAVAGLVISFLGLIGAAIGWIYFLIEAAQGTN